MEPLGIFLGLLIGAMLAYFGAWIGDWFVTRRDKKNRFRAECLEFKIALTPALAKFQHPRDDSSPVAITLTESFEAHLLAYVRFAFAVPDPSRVGLNGAWKQYEQYYSDHGDYRRNEFGGIGGLDYEREQRQAAIRHIDNLLAFTKDT